MTKSTAKDLIRVDEFMEEYMRAIPVSEMVVLSRLILIFLWLVDSKSMDLKKTFVFKNASEAQFFLKL